MSSQGRRASGYTGRDYGSYLTQREEWLEVCGLRDPQDVYDVPCDERLLRVDSLLEKAPAGALFDAYPLDGDHR